MNKYSDRPDYELNLAVARHLGHKPSLEHGVVKIKKELRHGVVIYSDNFDPCNNPADAMPIVKDNLISLEHDGIAWQVSCVRHPEISVWDGCENYNDNFYRKAMELFLLMKDAENEK